MLIFHVFTAAIVIGFIDPPYKVSESDGNATVKFGKLGTTSFQKEVQVQLSFSNGSAGSELFDF